jgi:D-xylose transport system substrate-binding protein
VPVISYDRLVTNADIDYYVSFDNVRVGRAPGRDPGQEAALGRSKQRCHDQINGAPTDNNAKLFKLGALSVLKTSGFAIAKPTPD